jgi:hypothetical protein
MLLHECAEFAAKAGGARGFMNDDAAAGLGSTEATMVSMSTRHERAQIDHFRVDAGFGRRSERDVHHGAVGEHGERLAFLDDVRLAERDFVIASGTSLAACFDHGETWRSWKTVERAVIDALRLHEDDRVIVFDGGDQQPLASYGVDGITVFKPATCVNRVSGDWLWVWPPRMPPP